jgi:SNF2 family DNA or RNA helicase
MRVAPLILRRTKERVAAELPPRIVVNEWCGLNPGQKQLYESILREHHRNALGRRGGEAAERMEMLTVLLRLRQICCDPGLLGDSIDDSRQRLEAIGSAKAERCAELVREAVLEGRKVLIFSQFAKMLRRLRDRFSDRLGIDSALLCGATTDRDAEIARFKRPDGPPVFLISLKAGGYGLNLTEADVVIHFDPWWNPAAEAQATDRAHRIGQTNPVNIYRLLTTGTVEAHVLRLQEKKRSLVGATLDESALGQARGIGTEELKGLLGGD